MILLIDNYDSFTYNVYQTIEELGGRCRVFRNDQITVKKMESLQPHALVISPGPGVPSRAGVSMEAIEHFSGRIPILGICLGHQSIGEVFGGRVIRAKKLMHGKVSQIHHHGRGLFLDLPGELEVARYHSLVIERESLPPELRITAWTDDDIIMGVQHQNYPVFGLQFHPESFATRQGHQLIDNFLKERW